MEADPDPILTTLETAKLLNTPVGTLRWWRHVGSGPKGFRLGARKVMYRRSDVLGWLDEQYAAETARARPLPSVNTNDAA